MSQSETPLRYRLRRPGGDTDPSKVFNAPGVIVAIVLTNIAVFLLVAFAPYKIAYGIAEAGALNPARFFAGLNSNAGLLGITSPLIAHMFLHGGLFHLAMNMFFLLAFGSPIAKRMGAENALGTSGAFASASMFLTFYLLCGILGGLAFAIANAGEYTSLVGASGGVSGLLGGLVRFGFSRTTLFGPEDARFVKLFSRPVMTITLVILATNNPIASSMLGAMSGGVNIAWEAHLGGYFFGLLTYPFFERAARGLR